MNLEPYWHMYDATLARVRDEKPDTFEALKGILDRFEPPSSGDAFFGDGADDTLADALHDAGWHVHYIEATYLYTARHHTTGARLRYVEGDVYDETRPHAVTLCTRCGAPLVPGCCDTTDITTDNIDADPTLDNPNFIEETDR